MGGGDGEAKKRNADAEKRRKESERMGCAARRVAGFDFVVGLGRYCYHGYGGSTAVLHY